MAANTPLIRLGITAVCYCSKTSYVKISLLIMPFVVLIYLTLTRHSML